MISHPVCEKENIVHKTGAFWRAELSIGSDSHVDEKVFGYVGSNVTVGGPIPL
jgi:hypothetical protein